MSKFLKKQTIIITRQGQIFFLAATKLKNQKFYKFSSTK
jgi:hypothetical protein